MVDIVDAFGDAIQAVIGWVGDKLGEAFKPLVEPVIEMVLNTPIPLREVDGTTTPAIFNEPTNNIFPQVYSSYYDAVIAALFLGMVVTVGYAALSTIGLTDNNHGLNSKSNWFKLLFAVILGYPLLMAGLHSFNILTHLFASGETVETISAMVAAGVGGGIAISAIPGAQPVTTLLGLISISAVLFAILFLVFHTMYLIFFPMFAPYFMLFYYGNVPVLKKASRMAFMLWIILGISKPIMAGLMAVSAKFAEGGGAAIFSGQVFEGMVALFVALAIPFIPLIVPTSLILGVFALAGSGVGGAMRGLRLGSNTPPAMAAGKPKYGSSNGSGISGNNVRPNSVANTRTGHAVRSGAATIKQASKTAARNAPAVAKKKSPPLIKGGSTQIAGQQTSLPKFDLPEIKTPTRGQIALGDKSKASLKRVVPYGEAAATAGSKAKKYGGEATKMASKGKKRALSTAPDAKWSLQYRSQFQDSLDTINKHGLDSDAGQQALDQVTGIMEKLPEGGKTKFAPDRDEMLAQIATDGNAAENMSFKQDLEHSMSDIMNGIEKRSEKIQFNNSRHNAVKNAEKRLGVNDDN